jgi:F-type H+-transporting ATPase subunit epsilon
MIHVELITPERLALSEDVEFIAAPASDGEIGILPHHAPLLTQLGPGLLRLVNGGKTHFVAVSGGFLEVQKDSRVSIFAESAEFAEGIDVERARLAAERAKARIVEADLTGKELAEVESALTRALLRIKISDVRRRRPASAPPYAN